MSKVFILQDNPYDPKDFSSAEKWGELVFVFDNHIHSPHLPTYLAPLRAKLDGAGKDDWMIPVGHPALIFAAGRVWYDITGNLHMLVWERKNCCYLPMRME